MTAVDFKKMNTAGYRAWRVSRAQGEWIEYYQKRIRRFKDYRGAIIFPEQLLNPIKLYGASFSYSHNISFTSHAFVINHPTIGTRNTDFHSIDEILYYEEESQPNTMSSMYWIDTTKPFETALFTNKESLMKFLLAATKDHLSTIG